MTKPMTLEELREETRLILKEIPYHIAHLEAHPYGYYIDKIFGKMSEFCESRNTCEVVEGELPDNPYRHKDLAEVWQIMNKGYESAQKDMLKWHEQSLRPVSSLLGGEK